MTILQSCLWQPLAGKAYGREGHPALHYSSRWSWTSCSVSPSWGTHQSLSLSACTSLSFLLDFVWKSKEGKTRTIEVVYVIIAFHLKMISAVLLECEAINMLRLNILINPIAQWYRETKAGFLAISGFWKVLQVFPISIMPSFYIGQIWAFINGSSSAQLWVFWILANTSEHLQIELKYAFQPSH